MPPELLLAQAANASAPTTVFFGTGLSLEPVAWVEWVGPALRHVSGGWVGGVANVCCRKCPTRAQEHNPGSRQAWPRQPPPTNLDPSISCAGGDSRRSASRARFSRWSCTAASRTRDLLPTVRSRCYQALRYLLPLRSPRPVSNIGAAVDEERDPPTGAQPKRLGGWPTRGLRAARC